MPQYYQHTNGDLYKLDNDKIYYRNPQLQWILLSSSHLEDLQSDIRQGILKPVKPQTIDPWDTDNAK